MDSRKIIYKLAIVCSTVLALVAFIFLAKGSLSLPQNTPPLKVVVDDTLVTLNSDQPVGLRLGSHSISFTSNYYDPFETTTLIFPWNKKVLDIPLNPNKAGKTLLDKGSLLAGFAANFSKTNNSKAYLDSMKKYLTDDAYGSLVFQIEDSVQSQSTTTPTDMPKVFLPTTGSYVEDTAEGPLVTIFTTKTAEESSLSNIQFLFEKIGSDWFVSNIIYN